jgi:LacI family transcriptional regulator
MAVRLVDIAKLTNIDVGTVSRVLSGKVREARVSANRAKLIRAAAESLGYRPNAAARAMIRGSFNCLSLVISTTGDTGTITQAAMNGMHDELATHDMHLNVTFVPAAKLASEDYIPKILREEMVDALVLNYTHQIPPRMAELIRQYNIPAIYMNARREADCVYFDDAGATEAATRHLLELGHRRIAYANLCVPLDEVNPHYSVTDRREGHLRAMREAGLEPMLLQRAQKGQGPTRQQAMHDLLTGPKRPTALVAYSPAEVQAAYVAALRLGLDVPADLSIIVFDASPVAVASQTFDTWRLPHAELGREAARMARLKIASPQDPLPPRVLPAQFSAGQSTNHSPDQLT